MAFSQDDTSVSKMENLLTCPICLEILKDPRTLPCFHSFCGHCLEKFVKKQREQALYAEIEEFNCPTCRSIFPLKSNENVSNITPSYVICNMLETFLPKSNAEKDGAGQRRHALKTSLDNLEDKLKEESEALQAVSNATQSLKENFARAKDEVERDKEDVLQAFSRKLEQKIQGITNDLNQKYNESFQSLSKQSAALDSHVNKLKSSLDIFKNIFESGNPDDTPSAQRMIEETVRKLEKERPETIKPVHDGSIHYQRKPIVEGKFTDQLFDDLLGEVDVSGSNEKLTKNNQENQVDKRDVVLLRAVGNPEFVPRSFQQPGAVSSLSSSSFLQSAIHAPEFIPRKPFHKYEETPAERIKSIEIFISGKIRMLGDDPGLFNEIATHMGKYLSRFIKNEVDLKAASDLLFEKCVSEQNFQYLCSRLANHLDKSLNPAGLSGRAFRTVFLRRCQVEYGRVDDMIQNNLNRVFNFALFLGELLMNFKTADGYPIRIFCNAVLNLIYKLLVSNNDRFLICAGKLLKLTGSMLDKNQEELFQKVKEMASNPNVGRNVRVLFTRVGQLRSTNWGRNEKLSQSTQPLPPEAISLYIPDLGISLEEQYDASPVVNQEQWNEFVVDGQEDNSEEDIEEDIEEDTEEIFKRMVLEQYGVYYPPHVTTDHDKRGSSYPHEDDCDADYDAAYEHFLQTSKVTDH